MQKNNTREAVILFADLINSTMLADILDSTSYDKIIRTFHEEAKEAFRDVFKKPPGDDSEPDIFKFLGDEVMLLILNESNESDISSSLFSILRFARLLKIRWLLTDHNLDRIKEGKRPHDIAIGINVGRVQCRAGEQSAEGNAIILAKRVEGQAREGIYTRIMLSRNAYQKSIEADARISFEMRGEVPVKGFAEKEHVFEIISFLGYIYWDPPIPLWKDPSKYSEIFNFDFFNKWLGIEIAIAHYYRMEFMKAVEVLNKVLIADREYALAILLRGECYFNLALNKKIDSDSQKVFFNRAECDMTKALGLHPSEDFYLQRGLLYFSFAQQWEKTCNLAGDPGINQKSDLLKKADADFTQAMVEGHSSERAVFWKLVLNLTWKKDKKVFPLLYQSGWITKNIEDNIQNDAALGKIIDRHVEKYRKVVFLDNYLANVYFAIGIIYSDIFMEPRKDKAKCWLRKAEKLAKEIKERDKTLKFSTAIYSSTLLMSFLQNIDEFIEGVKTALETVERSGSFFSSMLYGQKSRKLQYKKSGFDSAAEERKGPK